jgi:putative phosphoribosyl transferase
MVLLISEIASRVPPLAGASAARIDAAQPLLRRHSMTFLNRADAGRQLADALRVRSALDTVIIGVPRGGVPVAAEISRALGAPLDICIVRKLVVTRDLPVTIGALAEGGATYFDPADLARFEVTAAELAQAIGRESGEVKRLAELLRPARPIQLRGRDVIVVDDGIVTDLMLRAVAFAIRSHGVHSLELAAPVGASHVLEQLRVDFDRVTVLETDPDLVAVGARYTEFWPVSDAEIVTALETAPLHVRAVAV